MDRRQFGAIAISAIPAISGGHPRSNGERTIVSLETLAGVIHDEEWVIVDTRPTDAFNGWKLDGVARGGHLPTAVDFPADWLDHADKSNEAFVSILTDKQIHPHRNVVLDGTDPRQRSRVGDFLSGLGYTKLFEFDHHSWANDPSKPLERYENYHLIVPPIIVKQLLDGERPETFEDTRNIKFAEVSWGKENASYDRGHVPRSFHVNSDHFEPPPSWMLGSSEVLMKFAKRYGFHHEDTVIVSGADPTACYRLAIVLRYMGVRDVRVLNGGLSAWKASSFRVETKRNAPPVGTDFGKTIPQRPQLITPIRVVKSRLKADKHFQLIDTRTWAEFDGQVSGYSYHKKRGRIPGSIYGQGHHRGKDSLEPYRNIDQTMRNADEILELWKTSGISTEEHLSFFCGSGWRAAEVLTFAQVMGLSNTSLYSDGWIGWSNDPMNPVQSGHSE